MIFLFGVGFTLLSWIFDYKFEMIAERFARVENEVYMPSKDILLEKMEKLKIY